MGELKVRRRPSRSPQVGDMRERIAIYERKMAPPAFGDAAFQENLVLIATIWASLETNKGDKVFNQVNLANETAYVFRSRYTKLEIDPPDDNVPDPQARHIITHKGSNYRIRTVQDLDKRKRFLQINCTLLGDATVEVNK